MSGNEAWSTQQLVEFLALVSSFTDEVGATRGALEAVAQAVDSEVAAILGEGGVSAAIGFPVGQVPEEALAAAAADPGAVVLPGLGPCEVVALPLGPDDGRTLLVARAGGESFGRDERDLLRGMARVFVLTIRQLQRQNLLEQLSTLQRMIVRRDDPGAVLAAIVAGAAALIGDEVVGLRLLDEPGGTETSIVASAGLDADLLDETRHGRIGEGAGGRAIAEGRVVTITDYAHDDIAIGAFAARRLARAMAAPVHDRGEVVGSLVVASARVGGRYTAAQESMLVAFAEHASLALTDARMTAEARERAEELAVARDQALEASRMKSSFLANMSHEIRTPMNGVLGMTELLLESPLDQRQREYAEMIHSSGDALLTIVEDILDFSKIEAGKLKLESIEFEIADVVADVCELVAAKAHAKGLEVAWLVEPGVPAVVRGDRGRLRQVLTNLMGNAVKFTAEGEVVLTVATASADGDMLSFTVDDTGVGIEPDLLDRLFDAFSQADPSTTRRFGGTGLGLTVSRQLAHMMHGEIEASSTPGRGSAFRFTARLPRVAGSVDEEAILPGHRVLVVDQHGPTRIALVRWLERHGATVEHVGRWADAAGLLEGQGHAPFSLVVIDSEMADATVADVTRLTGQGRRGASALLLLHHARPAAPGALDATLLPGASEVVKPLRPGRLRETVAALVLAGSAASAAELVATGPPPGHGRILVAEDNPVNRALVVAMLGRRGYLVDVVEDGRQAVTAVRAGGYDLVLMDCQMPEMDGYDAAAAIRDEEPPGRRTPIVAMTASTMRGDRERCMAAGMDDYVAKPFRSSQLDEMLERWLHREPVAEVVPG